jgi:hypothetical protein
LYYKIRVKWISIITLVLFGFLGPDSKAFGYDWKTIFQKNTDFAYFWSGIRFGDKIFGGTHNGFQIWSHPPLPKAPDFVLPSGETVYSFCEFKGKLYCTNETRQVWRLDGNKWTEILEGNIKYQGDEIVLSHYFGLISFREHLYLNAYDWHKPYASAQTIYLFELQNDGSWKPVYKTNRSESTNFVYKGELYSAGKDSADAGEENYEYNAPAVITKLTSNGTFLEKPEVIKLDHDSFCTFGYEDPTSGNLILGFGALKTYNFDSGTYAELYLYDGANLKKRLFDKNLYRFTSAVNIEGKLYVLGDRGYEAYAGASKLFESSDSGQYFKWSVQVFDDMPCATTLVNYDGTLVIFGGKSFDQNPPGKNAYIKIIAQRALSPTRKTFPYFKNP